MARTELLRQIPGAYIDQAGARGGALVPFDVRPSRVILLDVMVV